MSTPIDELPRLEFDTPTHRTSDDDSTAVNEKPDGSVDSHALRDRLRVETRRRDTVGARFEEPVRPSPSQTREESSRLDDELLLQRAEKLASAESRASDAGRNSATLHRSRSRAPEPLDEFDTATNPIHERTQIYKPPANPSTKISRFFKKIHQSSFVVRYFTYIMPVFALLLIPILIGSLLPRGRNSDVGGVQLLWFGVWLEIVWLTLWAGRFAARLIPYPLGLISSLFTNNAKKWRDLGKALEIPATVFFWWLGIEISFLPTMRNHLVSGVSHAPEWTNVLNKIIVSIFVGVTLNFIEKIIIQLIAISFHLRTYADRIEINKFQIGSLTKLYIFSKAEIAMEDNEFEEKPSGQASGMRTPAMYATQAQHAVTKAFAKVGDVAGTVAGDFTGRTIAKSGHPSQVVLTLLNSTTGSQVLARRLWRTFVRDGEENVKPDDLQAAFDNGEEADAAFSMFDKDMNGDISMEELEAVCVEIGRERKSITASLKDLDSVVSRLDDVLFFIVCIVTVLVLISLISTAAAGVLTSAGSLVLGLSWLFSATAQEFLQSCVFVFIKHPFDVGDRVAIYGNTGSTLKGDDYFVKEISLLYTEFKKMEGHVVQAPNSYLNTLFILNQRRSGGLAEAVPIVIKFGTTTDQINALRAKLIEYVKEEKREFQGNILTELRDITEAYSLTLNIVFFYKSNWQNELLRLTRRNKFICSLMEAMQEVGIEGPRQTQAGWKPELPYYMQLPPGAPPLFGQNAMDPNGGQPGGGIAGDGTNDAPFIAAPLNPSSTMRRRPSTGQLGRPRGESLSSYGRRKDFSLGMSEINSGEQLSDVYEDRERPQYRELIREANRIDEERRTSESRDREGDGRSTSKDNHAMSGILRRSTTQSFGGRNRGESIGQPHRASISSQDTHRNRFLGRFKRSVELPRDSLAEEGQAPRLPPLDSRSGRVDSQAVRMDSTTSGPNEPFPVMQPVESQSEDFELRRVGQSSTQKPQ
ncbi:Mechanosensitive ion channel-domain-containing protein [Exophiala viscosa]|uniref:Mechanosensitive ion channel-domain-containing protein n=1 Tax=Exophiala viscosa TaxID=2486360 RepID=UPI00218CEBD0|nr:Mechanosensitive ion channel-domain-containing protein [Exophiala viscosa]